MVQTLIPKPKDPIPKAAGPDDDWLEDDLAEGWEELANHDPDDDVIVISSDSEDSAQETDNKSDRDDLDDSDEFESDGFEEILAQYDELADGKAELSGSGIALSLPESCAEVEKIVEVEEVEVSQTILSRALADSAIDRPELADVTRGDGGNRGGLLNVKSAGIPIPAVPRTPNSWT